MEIQVSFIGEDNGAFGARGSDLGWDSIKEPLSKLLRIQDHEEITGLTVRENSVRVHIRYKTKTTD